MFIRESTESARNAMYSKKPGMTPAVLTATCILCAVSSAVPFDPVFRILRTKGDCQVALPGSWEFTPVKPGKAYPFGSTVRTGSANSEAIVSLCDDHECRILQGTTAQILDEKQDRENRTVNLLAGKVEVELDQKGKFTNMVCVQTAVGAAIGEKSRFTATFSRQGEISEAIFECNSGMIGLNGQQFQSSVVKEGSIVKVTGPNDLSWLRVQTVKGDVPYELRDQTGEPVQYPTKAGATVKINQKVAELTKTRHVVIWTLKPDGTTETNYTYKIVAQTADAAAPGGGSGTP
jgi:hypothetical protein